MMDHAEQPTDAWLLYRQGRGAVDPKLLEIARIYRERVIGNISRNQLGTAAPPPVVRIALDGFLAYTETVIESALAEQLPRDQVIELVGGTLMAAMNAAAGASLQPPPLDEWGGRKAKGRAKGPMSRRLGGVAALATLHDRDRGLGMPLWLEEGLTRGIGDGREATERPAADHRPAALSVPLARPSGLAP